MNDDKLFSEIYEKRVIDYVNRYRWYNLPDGLDSELMERVLYFRGQGMFFYDQISEKFMFLPYALDGEIDVYGRFLGVTPLPMGATTVTDENGKEIPWIKDYKKKPRYEFLIKQTWDNYVDDCVLIHDKCIGLSQLNTPQVLFDEDMIREKVLALDAMKTNANFLTYLKVIEKLLDNRTTGIVLQDGLKERQRACDLINGVWSLGVSCELSDNNI